MDTPSYSRHLDTITALTSFLAMTSRKSMTVTRLSNALSLDKDEVNYVLSNFKSLFRKSKRVSPKTKDNYYTLHLRYGLRSQSDEDDENEDIARDPLGHEYLSSLLEFITKQAKSDQRQLFFPGTDN